MPVSYWIDTAPSAEYPPLEGDIDVEVAVLGAGITGVTAALLLHEAGKSVALVEANRVCRGVTGYTTAKLTAGHSLIYADLADRHGREAARLYAESNEAAIETIERIAGECGIDCDLERADNYVYSESDDDLSDLESEVAAAREAGLAAELVRETELPYRVAGAVRLANEAQFHPRKYVLGLVERLAADGCRIYEQTRACKIEEGSPCTVETTGGSIRARDVVVATHIPFSDRGFFFAKVHPGRSYAIAAPAGSQAPRGMYISTSSPTRSIRTTPGEDGRVLIVGGEGHKPGDDPDTEARYAALERFLAERFDGGEVTHRWSTQDYTPVDRLPYIGRLTRRSEHVHVATGFAKWGLTKGTFAAEIIADAILGRPNRFAALYDAKRLKPAASARTFASENASVALHFVGDRLRRGPRPEELAPGEGAVVLEGGRHLAVHRDDAGELHAVSARCTHMGCLVGWNQAERSWDCPCHGSRFTATGEVIQGPAVADLEPREL